MRLDGQRILVVYSAVINKVFGAVLLSGPKQPAKQAGMISYYDEGSENGGLIFGGRANEKGGVAQQPAPLAAR